MSAHVHTSLGRATLVAGPRWEQLDRAARIRCLSHQGNETLSAVDCLGALFLGVLLEDPNEVVHRKREAREIAVAASINAHQAPVRLRETRARFAATLSSIAWMVTAPRGVLGDPLISHDVEHQAHDDDRPNDFGLEPRAGAAVAVSHVLLNGILRRHSSPSSRGTTNVSGGRSRSTWMSCRTCR